MMQSKSSRNGETVPPAPSERRQGRPVPRRLSISRDMALPGAKASTVEAALPSYCTCCHERPVDRSPIDATSHQKPDFTQRSLDNMTVEEILAVFMMLQADIEDIPGVTAAVAENQSAVERVVRHRGGRSSERAISEGPSKLVLIPLAILVILQVVITECYARRLGK